jgi:putative tRNA adenosine deaminase-associated protein
VPAGDLAIFDDLGLDSSELLAILSDIDAYADEMIGSIAGRVGFADVFDRALAAE